MTIFIDNRVGSRELAHHLQHGIKHTLTTLTFADAAFIANGPLGPGTVYAGVERKRLRDFLNSMETGRLAGHQLIGMCNSYNRVYLVIEGIWREGDSGLLEVPKGKGKWEPLELGSRRFTVSAVDNFTNELWCMFNAMVVFTPTLARTCHWLSNIYRWWTSKKWHQHRAYAKKRRVDMPVLPHGEKQPLAARVLVEFAGVGPDKALKISSAMETSNLGLAGLLVTEELMKIDGIGKTTADEVMRQGRKLLYHHECPWCGGWHEGGPERCER